MIRQLNSAPKGKEVDGVYRPEASVSREWMATAYIPFRGEVNWSVYSETRDGHTAPVYFYTEEACQICCDQLNNQSSKRSSERLAA